MTPGLPSYAPEVVISIGGTAIIPLLLIMFEARGSGCRLGPHFIGLYPVKRMVNPATVRPKLLLALKVHLVFHVSQVKPVSTSPLCPPAAPPPPVRLVDGAPAFMVRWILDIRRRGRGYQYLVDWEGYGSKGRRWISWGLILDPSLIGNFHEAHPEKAKPWVARWLPLGGGVTVSPVFPQSPS